MRRGTTTLPNPGPGARGRTRRLTLLACLALLAAARTAAAECRVTVRFNSNDAPISMADAQGQATGISPDVMREVLRRMGCIPQFIDLPWARGLARLRSGDLAVLPDIVRTPEREEFAWYSDEYANDDAVLFIRKESVGRWHFTDLQQLRDTEIHVGVGIDALYSAEYRSRLGDPVFRSRLVPVSKRESQWKMLALGRLDAVLCELMTGRRQLREAGLEQKIVDYPLLAVREPAYVAFSKKIVTADFVVRFNAALATLRADGTIAAIRQRHLVQ